MQRLKDVMMILILPTIVATAIIAPAVVSRNQNRQQLELTCEVIHANILELRALKEIGHEIGLPTDFVIPKLPPECEDKIGTNVSGFQLRNCTQVGSNRSDIMAGTRAQDVMCGRKGNDYIAGNGKPDRLLGQSGNDTLVGGNGADRLKGGDGVDRIFAIDKRATDIIRGGPDHDQCFVDRGDETHSCDQLFIGGTIEAIRILQEQVYKMAVEAEEVHPPCPPGPC